MNISSASLGAEQVHEKWGTSQARLQTLTSSEQHEESQKQKLGLRSCAAGAKWTAGRKPERGGNPKLPSAQKGEVADKITENIENQENVPSFH